MENAFLKKLTGISKHLHARNKQTKKKTSDLIQIQFKNFNIMENDLFHRAYVDTNLCDVGLSKNLFNIKLKAC